MNNAILKKNYTLELLMAFKMAYSCFFSLEENLDFLDFLRKKFYNINYREISIFSRRKTLKKLHFFFLISKRKKQLF